MVAAGPPDGRIAAVAGLQYGRIARAQLLALGVTPAMIKTRLHAGRIHQSHRGVYTVGHQADIPRGPETAALLAIGPPVALSHESAGCVWGIWTVAPLEVHVSVPAQRAQSRPGIRVHRSLSLTAADVTLRDGLPVTTVARVVLDLAERHPVRAVERALDEGLHRRLVTPAQIDELLARSPGRRGAHTLKRLIDPDRARGITREAAEERLLGLIRRSNLPDPERNVQLGRFSVDFLWRDAGVAVEFDSFRWHTGPRAFERDRAKDAHLRDLGLDLHRVTWSMLDDPLPLVARLARATARGIPADAA